MKHSHSAAAAAVFFHHRWSPPFLSGISPEARDGSRKMSREASSTYRLFQSLLKVHPWQKFLGGSIGPAAVRKWGSIIF
jgi:hypothetical protein